MKIPAGMTIYRDGRKYQGSIPDDLMPSFQTEPVMTGDVKKKPKASK